MKLTEHQFLEAGFIFEKENGSNHSDFERDVISKSNLISIQSSELKAIIRNGINSELYNDINNRTTAYWALSKTNDKNMIPQFKKWLIKEIEVENHASIFQILIALDRLEEPAFHKERNSRYFDDIKLNLRDAKNYLNRQ